MDNPAQPTAKQSSGILNILIHISGSETHDTMASCHRVLKANFCKKEVRAFFKLTFQWKFRLFLRSTVQPVLQDCRLAFCEPPSTPLPSSPRSVGKPLSKPKLKPIPFRSSRTVLTAAQDRGLCEQGHEPAAARHISAAARRDEHDNEDHAQG